MLEFLQCAVISVLIFEGLVSSPGWIVGKQEKKVHADLGIHQQDQGRNYSATL
jgi:hypothetical protein